MDGRTRFPSKIYFSLDRSFVRSSKRARLVGRRTFEGALPTCAADSCNLLVARSLPLSTLASVAFSPPQCLTPSSSPVWFLARMFEFTRKWAWHWHTDGGRTSRESGRRRRPRKLVAASAVGNALLPISFNEFSYVESCAFISNEIISTSLAPYLSVGLLFFLPLQSSFISFPAH